MATAEQLVAAVQGIVQDPGYTITEILPLINEGLALTATEILMPSLDAMATVNTDTVDCYANLPNDYSQGIYAAMDGDLPLAVYESWSGMAREYVDLAQTGDVKSVAVKGATLMYLPIPAEATPITIYYYRQPTALVAGATLDGFTKATQAIGEAIVTYYAAFRIFDIIEDGVEGQKVNTIRWEKRYLEMMVKLKSIVRSGVSRPQSPRNKLW